MKYLKDFKLFESWIAIGVWENFTGLIQSEIMDEWGISNSLVDEVYQQVDTDKNKNPLKYLEPA